MLRHDVSQIRRSSLLVKTELSSADDVPKQRGVKRDDHAADVLNASGPMMNVLDAKEATFDADENPESCLNAGDGTAATMAPSLRCKTALPRKPWPKRLKDFFGSLPVRNMANDYVLWDMSADDIWDRYQLLPSPQCAAISRTALRFILSSLASVKPKTKKVMQRYESIMDEMRAQNPPIVPLREEWDGLMAFYARMHKHPNSNDVERCLQLWQEMEAKYNVMARIATFNILLDVAVKSGNRYARDLLLQEMKSRGLRGDKYTWTTRIYAAGLDKDGAEVQRLARAMLANGEVLNILVANAIISALLRAGDHTAAERLFNAIPPAKTPLTTRKSNAEERRPQDDARALADRRHERMNAELRFMDDQHAARGDLFSGKHLPALSLLHRNEVTYNMMLKHRCETGDFEAVSSLLQEMSDAHIHDTEAMFGSLFAGFRIHAASNPTWSMRRLRYVFQTFLNAAHVRITQVLALRVVEAFAAFRDAKELERAYKALDREWQARGGLPQRRSTNVVRLYDAALASIKEENSREQEEARKQARKARRQARMNP